MHQQYLEEGLFFMVNIANYTVDGVFGNASLVCWWIFFVPSRGVGAEGLGNWKPVGSAACGSWSIEPLSA